MSESDGVATAGDCPREEWSDGQGGNAGAEATMGADDDDDDVGDEDCRVWAAPENPGLRLEVIRGWQMVHLSYYSLQYASRPRVGGGSIDGHSQVPSPQSRCFCTRSVASDESTILSAVHRPAVG